MNIHKKYLQTQKGAVFALFGVLFLSFLAFGGMAVDLGTVYLQKTQLQNAADAGALAGAGQLGIDITSSSEQQTITDNFIKKYINLNVSDAQVGTMTATTDYPENTNTSELSIKATYATIANTSSSKIKTVTVELRRNMPTYFLRIFGFSSIPVEVIAKAKYESTGGSSTYKNPFSDPTDKDNPFNYTIATSYDYWSYDRIDGYNTQIKGDYRTDHQIYIPNDTWASQNTITGTITGLFDAESDIWTNYYGQIVSSSTKDFYNPTSASYTEADNSMNILYDPSYNGTGTSKNPETAAMSAYINSVKKMSSKERQAAHIYYGGSDVVAYSMGDYTNADGSITHGVYINGDYQHVYTSIITNGSIVIDPTGPFYTETNGVRTEIMANIISLGNGTGIYIHQTGNFTSTSYAPKGFITIDGTGEANGSYVAQLFTSHNSGQVIGGYDRISGGGSSGLGKTTISLIDPEKDV